MTRDLPPRLHFRDGGFYYVHKNKWTHIGHTRPEALGRYARIEHGLSEHGHGAPAWFALQTYYPQCFWRARKNARSRTLEFTLTREEFDAIVARANDRCEVTGIPFELTTRPGSERRPFAPSLDRIDAHQPYTASNCRLVCCIVNAALSDWGEGIFWKMVRRAGRKLRDWDSRS